MIQIDMEMPKSCKGCPMHINSNDYCKARHDFSCFVRAKNNCPLKEVNECKAEDNSVLEDIRRIVFPLTIMSTDKLEHEAIMKIAEILDNTDCNHISGKENT